MSPPILEILIPPSAELGSRRARQQVWESALVKHTIGGLMVGLAVGIACDVAVNGYRRIAWRFSIKKLALAGVATAAIISGIVSLWKIANLPPPNY